VTPAAWATHRRDLQYHGRPNEVAGQDLARSLTELGLIDEYRIYLHPVVLGHGKPYFAGPRPLLRLMTNDRIGEDVIRLTYVPA
jgi:dihydrofolate reductase